MYLSSSVHVNCLVLSRFKNPTNTISILNSLNQSLLNFNFPNKDSKFDTEREIERETYLSLQTFFSGTISSTGLNVLSEDLRDIFFNDDSRHRAPGRSCGTRRTGPLGPTVLRAIRILDLNRGGGAQILRLDLRVAS